MKRKLDIPGQPYFMTMDLFEAQNMDLVIDCLASLKEYYEFNQVQNDNLFEEYRSPIVYRERLDIEEDIDIEVEEEPRKMNKEEKLDIEKLFLAPFLCGMTLGFALKLARISFLHVLSFLRIRLPSSRQ
jgi:hypothetical protein